MKRLILIVAALLVVSGIARPAGAQAERRRIALVYEVVAPPLFAPTGQPEETADFNVDQLLQRLRAIETDHADTPLAITLNAVLCDELRLLATSSAERAIAGLRRIARRHPVLQAPYADARFDHLERDDIRREVEDGAKALRTCTGTQPVEPFVPADLSVTSAVDTWDLRRSGVRSMLSAYAVPPTDRRPRIVPAYLVGGDHELPLELARPETSDLVVVVESEQVAYLDTVLDDERVQVVAIGKLDGQDVIGGLIDPGVDVPQGRVRAMRDATEAVDRFHSYTLRDNPLRDVYRTVLARSRGAEDGVVRARRLADEIARQRGLITVSDGSVTFTSRRGDVPVTISNGNEYPVRVVVELRRNAKLDFLDTPKPIEIKPPGDTITFESLTRSSGSFPTVVVLKSPDRKVTFGDAEVTVRSVSANLSAVVLTAGGAGFLVYWFIRGLRRRRGQTQA